MTDVQLIEQYLSGNVQAFNTLIWRHEAILYNFILRVVGNRDLARDICQMTCIRIFKEIKRLRDKEKFKSWMYRIAMNLCLDEIKKRNKRRYISLHEENTSGMESTIPLQIEDEDTQAPDDAAHHGQVIQILNQALQDLPEEQRIVIVMKQYQDLKFTEIADILGESVNTIKSRLYYGLKAMKKSLEASSLTREVLLNEM